MKTKKFTKIIFMMSLFLSLGFFTSCSDDDDTVVRENDIVDTAINTPDLSILVAALQRADLVSALQANGPFTVFAPTNTAFQALLDSNSSWNSLEDIPLETLKSVLLFHVVSGKVMSTDLSDTYVNTLSTGPGSNALSLQVEVTGGVEFNGDSKPISTDIAATNGVIHTIDKVMLPANVVTLALNNAGFSTLVAALTDSRHTTDFVTLLQANGPYTVFAPTNLAFQTLLDSNNFMEFFRRYSNSYFRCSFKISCFWRRKCSLISINRQSSYYNV